MSEDRTSANGIVKRFYDWIHEGSLVKQVGNVFNLFVALTVVLAGFALLGVYRLDQRADMLSDLTEVAFQTSEISRDLSRGKDGMGAYRARGLDPELIADAVANAESARDLGDELVATAADIDPAMSARAAALSNGLTEAVGLIAEVGTVDAITVEQESFLGPRYDAIDATLVSVNQLNAEAAERVETYAGEGASEIQMLMGVLAVIAAIAVSLVFFGKRLVARQIVQPIAAISDASEQIAEGNFAVKIPGRSREDEIGILAKSLSVLRKTQQERAERAEVELENQRKAEAEREEQRKERAVWMQSLADKFEVTIGDVANEVATASSQLHNAADELAKNVETSSSRVVDADTNLQEASSGMTGAAAATDEFVLSISEVSRQAATSSNRAQKAAEAATDADVTIGEMTNSAEKISQIVEVIAGIAQRTNLLALNASIEAARGSDAGRGFAVVAAEVKELAAQTSRATSEAEELIHMVQNSTGKSATALTTIATEVIELQSASTMIASAVDQQAVAGQDLAKSIDMAARNTELVSTGFREVSELAVATGSTASQLRDSSGHLIRQSDRLRNQVKEFLQHVRAA